MNTQDQVIYIFTKSLSCVKIGEISKATKQEISYIVTLNDNAFMIEWYYVYLL